MLKALMCGLIALSVNSYAAGKEISVEKGKLLFEENFEKEVDSKKFKSGIGAWKVSSGFVHGAEQAKDEHVAASRVYQATQDAVYEFRFRFTEGGKSINCGFDPAKGELDKKGHLWAVAIKGGKWRLSKALDKNKPKEDPAKTLASGKISIKKGEWYTMKIVSVGNRVSVSVGENVLAAEHESFHVKKPTLIFRCGGDGIDFDDVKIWEVKQ